MFEDLERGPFPAQIWGTGLTACRTQEAVSFPPGWVFLGVEVLSYCCLGTGALSQASPEEQPTRGNAMVFPKHPFPHTGEKAVSALGVWWKQPCSHLPSGFFKQLHCCPLSVCPVPPGMALPQGAGIQLFEWITLPFSYSDISCVPVMHRAPVRCCLPLPMQAAPPDPEMGPHF